MLGFVFGTICLALLFSGARRPRPHAHWGRHRRRSIGAAFHWLRVRPDQREPLEEALHDLAEDASGLGASLDAERRTLAAALEAETLDAHTLEDLWTRAQVELEARKEGLLGALTRIHATLDPAQRTKLAHLVARGRGHHGAHLGAYRSWA